MHQPRADAKIPTNSKREPDTKMVEADDKAWVAREALRRLQERISHGDVVITRQGFFNWRLVFEGPSGETYCEVPLAPLLRTFNHSTNCTVLDTDLTLKFAGVCCRHVELLANGRVLFSLDKRAFRGNCVVADGEGTKIRLRQRGSFRQRAFELAHAPPTEVFRFHFAPVRFKATMAISPTSEMKADAVAAAAILLCYDWLLSLRTMIVTTSSRA